MQTTNNLGLKKPGAEDVVNIEDLNSNSDVLDGKFGASSGHGHTGAAGDGPKIGSGGLATGAATDTVIGSRTVSDTTAPIGDSGTPTTLFGWLANRIKAITGKSSWRTAPAISLEDAKQNLDALSARLTDSNTQTTALVPGQNLITASEAGPLAVTVKGNTLAHPLGTDGRCESLTGWTTGGTVELSAAKKRSGEYSMKISTANSGGFANKDFSYPLDTAKYYIFAAWIYIESWTSGTVQLKLQDKGGSPDRYVLNANPTIVGSWQFAYVKIPTANIITTTNGFRLTIGNGASGTFVFYADEVRVYEASATDYAAIGTIIIGEAIDQRFPYVDGVKHITNPVITKRGKNLLPPFTEWTGDGGTQNITGPYELEVTTANWNHGPYVVIDSLPLTQYTIRVGESSGVALDIASRDSANTNTAMVSGGLLSSYTFTTPANSVRLWIKVKNSVQIGKYRAANVQLELGSSATPFEPLNDDYLYAMTTMAGYGGVNDALTVRGTEAMMMRRWKTDVQIPGTLLWTVSSDEAGYKTLYTDNFGSDGLSNGLCVGSRPDGNPIGTMYPSGVPNRAIVSFNAGTSKLYMNIPDALSGWGEDYTPLSDERKAYFWGWKMNNGTFGTPYNGSGTKTWTKWDATSNTGAVTTVPTTMAEGYTPYKLSYQLVTPVTEVVSVEGSLANHAGANLYEVGEGVIVREKIVPKTDAAGRYYIIGNAETRKDSSWGTARTAFSVSKFLQVYKNREKNYGWTISAANNASIDPANYDTTAEYTVTYMALDKYALTVPVVEGTLEYKNNLSGVTSELVKQMADNNTRDTIQDGRLMLDEAYIRNLNMDLSGATAAATPSTIVKRDSGGRAQVAAPVTDADIVNRGFVMSNFARAHYADNSYTAATLPSVYPPKATTTFFVNDSSGTQGWPELYGTVQTIKGYASTAAVQFFYSYVNDYPVKFRYAVHPTDAWRPWREVLDSNGPSATTKISKLNADMVDGLHVANPGTHAGIINAIPFVGSDSVMEIGAVLDFHDTAGSTSFDYDARLTAVRGNSNGQGTLQMMGALMQVPALRVRSATPYMDVVDTDGNYFTRIIVDNGNLVLQQRRVSDGGWINDFLTIPMSGAISKIWTTENDGAGSGLDADLLDGQQGSYYATASAAAAAQNKADAALPKDGSAPMTGSLIAPRLSLTDYGTPMEIGRYIDLHKAGSSNDYDARITITNENQFRFEPAGGSGWELRNNGGFLEVNAGGGWIPVGGATYVASSTVRADYLTELGPTMVSGYESTFGTLIHRFVPRFTGEVNVTFEAKGLNYRDEDDNYVYVPTGLRAFVPAMGRQMQYDNSGNPMPMYGQGGNLPFFDSRTPIGTRIGGQPGPGMIPIFEGVTVSGNYDGFGATISVQAGIPIYFFAWTRNPARTEPRFRNFRLYYDII